MPGRRVTVRCDVLPAAGSRHGTRTPRISRTRSSKQIVSPRGSTRQGVLALTEFDPVFGARPLRRLIQTTIEDQLAQRVLAGEVREGDTVTFDVDESSDGLIILESQPAVA